MTEAQYLGLLAAIYIARHTSPGIGLAVGGVLVVLQIMAAFFAKVGAA